MPRRLGLVGVILVGSVVVAFAMGGEPRVNVSITVAGQEGPLEIIGFKPAGNSDGFALHIHNLSDKATRDFWVQPLVRNSRGQLWHFANGHAALRPGEGAIPAGGEAWDSNSARLRVNLVLVAKDLRSTCLRVTPIVMAVDFVDGTSWKVSPQQETEALARADRVAKASACAETARADDYFGQLDSFGLKTNFFDSYRSEEPSAAQSFKFSCSLHRINDSRVTAVCGSSGNE
jgi:hypothetical protein